jgi:hypothetical protein
MHLSDHSLRQIDNAYLLTLEMDALRGLSERLLADLKEARERLNQGPSNSSRPPSSRAPWEQGAPGEPSREEEEAPCEMPESKTEATVPEAVEESARRSSAETKPNAPARKPGKQPGAPGFGRTQVFEANEVTEHYPECCAGCGRAFGVPNEAVAYTAFQEVDLRWGERAAPGLRLWVTNHRYHEVTCDCGHHTRVVPGRGEVDPLLSGVELSEWRLVGPGMAALIVALTFRFRLSRARVREFLEDWLGLKLSIGTIHQTLHEAAAAVAPAEEELVEAVEASGLLHADETPWHEGKEMLWLWVFVSATTPLYYIASRGKELVLNVLRGFGGWLMTDGWISYRGYPLRLRCWAHLLRKARGLAESYHREARAFGGEVLTTLEALMKAVYAAREGPSPGDLTICHERLLADLRAACERARGNRHAKTHALAVEFLNDWMTIFQVLRHPELPLTNNEAERALRHWVILRKLSHGSRNEVGSRVVPILASVIDTCRQRGHSPWPYLKTAIADRRAGRTLAPLPAIGV